MPITPPNPQSISLPNAILIAEYNSDYIHACIEEYVSSELIKILKLQLTPSESEIKLKELQKIMPKNLPAMPPCGGGSNTGTAEM